MSIPSAPTQRTRVVEACVARIEAHLVRLAQGHDPWGHLFAIERVARSGRAEWRAVEHGQEREGQRP